VEDAAGSNSSAMRLSSEPSSDGGVCMRPLTYPARISNAPAAISKFSKSHKMSKVPDVKRPALMRKSSAICAPGCMPILLTHSVINSAIFQAMAMGIWWTRISQCSFGEIRRRMVFFGMRPGRSPSSSPRSARRNH
jgi:hypothetical protein